LFYEKKENIMRRIFEGTGFTIRDNKLSTKEEINME
jgi:hypothetical protein